MLRHLVFDFVLLVLVLPCSGLVAQDGPDSAPTEPDIHWIFPLGGSRGTSVTAEIQGSGLGGVYAVWFPGNGITAQIKSVEENEQEEQQDYKGAKAKKKTGQRVTLQLTIDSAACLGPHSLRLVSRRGISNPVSFFVNPVEVKQKTKEPRDSPRGGERPVTVPVMVSGRINQEGKVDYYIFDVAKDCELDFEVLTHAESFRPTLRLYKADGSWLTPGRPSRLHVDKDAAYATSAHQRWKHRFKKAGRYLVRVGSRYGAASDGFIYQLRITRADQPAQFARWSDRPGEDPWRERTFKRELSADRLKELWSRTVERPVTKTAAGNESPSGTPRAAGQPAPAEPAAIAITTVEEQEPNQTRSEAHAISWPVFIKGTIQRPGDADLYQFEVDSGERLVFEVQTPEMAPPQFNPRLEILDFQGSEFLTNKHRKIALVRQDPISYVAILKLHLAHHDNCGLRAISYFSQLEPKMAVTFGKGGQYYLRVRDITTQRGGCDHRYRIVIRPAIPHVGEIDLNEDRVNLVAGEARKLSLVTGHEEGFSGEIALRVEGLPPGVEAVTGAAVEPKGPPGHASDHEGAFVPRTQTVTILLLARPDTAATEMPRIVRVTARPIVQGKLGAPLPVAEIPLMVRVDEGETGAPTTEP